jgi:hypothetical protein
MLNIQVSDALIVKNCLLTAGQQNLWQTQAGNAILYYGHGTITTRNT